MADEKKQSDSPEGGPEGVEGREGSKGIGVLIPPPMGTLPPVIIPPTPPAVVGMLLVLPTLHAIPPNIIAMGPRAAQTDELVADLAALAKNVLQAAPEEKVAQLHKLVRRLRKR
jgi:hypothetical protein